MKNIMVIIIIEGESFASIAKYATDDRRKYEHVKIVLVHIRLENSHTHIFYSPCQHTKYPMLQPIMSLW